MPQNYQQGAEERLLFGRLGSPDFMVDEGDDAVDDSPTEGAWVRCWIWVPKEEQDDGADPARLTVEQVNAQADAEGWGLYEADRGLQLQRDDLEGEFADGFADDRAAWRHVAARAEQGSHLHREALRILGDENPEELERIQAVQRD